MKKILYSLIFFCLILILIHSCGSDRTLAPDINTILRTDEQGNVLGGDFTDWCYDSNYVGYKLYPAFPNPTDSVVHIRFSIPTVSTVKLYFDNEIFINNEQRQPGTYQITISKGTYSAGIRKIYFNANYFNCSGDIQFE
jgi:hypothetical protein